MKNKTRYNKSKSKTTRKKQICTTSYKSFEREHEKSALYVPQKSNTDVDTALVKTIKASFSPSKITPQSDYYTYINFIWLDMMQKQENKTAKKYYSQIDEFREVQDKVYQELIVLVKEYIKKNKTDRATEISNVFHSFLNLNEAPIKQHIIAFSEIYDQQIKANNLWNYLALINKNEIISWGSPIVWAVMPDEKKGNTFRNIISNPQLTLYDYNLYSDDTKGHPQEYITYRKHIKQEYLAYINKVFELTLGKNHDLNAADVFQVEVEILAAMDCIQIKNDSYDFYNVVKPEESLKKYGFDWTQFCKCLGYKQVPDFYICSSLNYLSCMMKKLNTDWSSKKWKSYWYYIFLRQIIRFHKHWRLVYYEFNDKLLSGMQVPYPPEVVAVIGLSFTFNTLLSEEYIAKNKNPAAIDYTKSMGQDLIDVFKRRISRHSWFDAYSKKQALLKLNNLNLIIGYPDKMRYDPLLNYSSNDAWGNMLKITQWKTQKFLNLEGRDVIDIPYIDWKNLKLIGKQPYIVNAFYTPTENSIYIPLAYLQKPFIDLEERGIEYNLARIGFTLAHEMSHSLDDFGSKYDYKGNLVNWASPTDQAKIKKIQDDITKQYEVCAKRDGIIFDASIAIGENMADIAGLAICEEYLKDFQDKNDDVIPIKDLSFQAFFVYVAISNKQHVYKNAIKSQLKVNPHPLDKYRVNVPLSRLELFRSIYNIKKGDDMYWPSTSTIW
jgi:putative endopeptidase